MGGASVTKVLRRRGLGGHAQVRADKRPTNQWDPGFEENAVPLVELSDLACGGQSCMQAKLLQHSDSNPAVSGKAVPAGKPKAGIKLRERSLRNPDLSVHTSPEKSGVTPVSAASRNSSSGYGNTSKPGPGVGGDRPRFAVRRKSDFYVPRFNQTRFKTLAPSRVSPDPAVFTLGQTQLATSPGKPGAVRGGSGVTRGGMGAQTQGGNDSTSSGGAVPAGKDPDKPSTSAQIRSDLDSDPSIHTKRDAEGDPVPRPGGKGGSESGGSAITGDPESESAPRITLAARSQTLGNGAPLLTPHGGQPTPRNLPAPAHHRPVPDPDSGNEHGDQGRFLKLQPDSNQELGRAEAGGGVGSLGRGLVFQEVGDGRGQEGEESRSRSRRSWIWNQFFVIEEYSGPEPVLIGRLHTDMDRGDGRTKYILRGEGAGSVFVIDEKTGNIHVTKPLDREEKDEYRLIATATDRQTERALEPSSQFIIRVQDINDNPPVFQDGPYSATVPEMANIGTSIIQVTATDADDPTYGNSARLVYTLVQGQQYFSVDPQTGILRTAVPDMDRETQDTHLVVLQAKDMGGHLGGLSGTTTVTIRLSDVNDNPPRFTQSVWSFSVSELAVPGAEVGRLSATDADLGDHAKLEYSIVDGEGGDTFNITGLDQEAIITLNKAVDYEGRSLYTFSVEVVNPMVDPRFLRRGPFKDRATVRVSVLDADEPPRFSRTRYRLDVMENCPPSCTVGRVGAVDPDTGLGNNIRYSIDPQSDPEALFRIAPDNGLITTAVELDREREQWHNITVIATQRDSPSQVSRVVVAVETLDVNDNAPELDREYNTALCDSATAGQVVQVLRAIDKDKGGNESLVHFSIPPGSSAGRNFSIRASGGPTASLVLLSPLQVPLVLKDSLSGLTSTGTVTVSVCPCLRGGARAGEKDRQTEAEWEREAVCLPMPSSSPSPGLSTAALLAILACVVTLLAVSALSLSLRRQKRDSLSPLEEDDVRENIITYDDEGGGEADTAAFDIAALQSAPHSACRGYRTLDSRNIRCAGQAQERARTYSWAQGGEMGYPSSAAPLYGRLSYSSHTLPVLRHAPGPGLAELPYHFPTTPEPGSAHTQQEPQGAVGGSDIGLPATPDSKDSISEPGSNSHNLDWSESLVLTRCGPSSSWGCDSSTLPSSGRRGSRAGPSPTRISTGASVPDLNAGTNGNANPGESQVAAGSYCRTYGGGHQGVPMEGTVGRRRLERDGRISLAGTTCLYPEGAGLMTDWGEGRGRRDMLPQLLAFPGQTRGALGQLGFGGGWSRGGTLWPCGWASSCGCAWPR
ncbi:hypothetical protein AGOR_G00171880 [Albula goreensis]|uniref:Cadherin domain-containing protein n=1 Tax=Albula goreensis TaxID=1534307 RepID=A0A8T3CZD4_9TELE|nr:hypothetical protein AGOR_G00171880 [Albula goreensis]